jgi:glycosyltransferase involved in cell wall biosynthesis
LNAGSTLAWTLQSLRSQVNCSVDVVVVDSGSTDGTGAIISSAGVRAMFEPPGNMYRAVNAGLRSVDSPWLTYLNGDDVAYADAYATLIDLGEKGGADIVYGDCDYVDWHGRFLYSMRSAAPRLLKPMFVAGVMPFNQPCAVFRRSVFERLGGFDEEFRHISDFAFFGKAALNGVPFVRAPDFPVIAFRLHGAQFSAREHPVTRQELSRWRSREAIHYPRGAWLAALQWRLANMRAYLLRRLRTGQWSGRPYNTGRLAVEPPAASNGFKFDVPAASDEG